MPGREIQEKYDSLYLSHRPHFILFFKQKPHNEHSTIHTINISCPRTLFILNHSQEEGEEEEEKEEEAGEDEEEELGKKKAKAFYYTAFQGYFSINHLLTRSLTL